MPSAIYKIHLQFFFSNHYLTQSTSTTSSKSTSRCRTSRLSFSMLHPQRPQKAQLWRVQQVPVMFIKNWHDTWLYANFQRKIDLIGPSVMLLDTLRNLYKLKYGKYSKYQLCSSKNDMTHVLCYCSKTNQFKTDPAWYRVIKMLLDILSDRIKVNHRESIKKMGHGYILFF